MLQIKTFQIIIYWCTSTAAGRHEWLETFQSKLKVTILWYEDKKNKLYVKTTKLILAWFTTTGEFLWWECLSWNWSAKYIYEAKLSALLDYWGVF